MLNIPAFRQDNKGRCVAAPDGFSANTQHLLTANLFVMVERLSGYRHVEVTARRTAVDYARQLQWLADVRYPDAKKIRLVQDNLNTHRVANLYLVYPPAEAQRLAQRFEVQYTPTHASWLNMAEIEIAIFERGCLRKRVGSLAILQQQITALETERNAAKATINWRFTTCNARVRLARLYPRLEASADAPPTI